MKLPVDSLFVGIPGTELEPFDRELLLHPAVGGVILFTRNYETPGQLAGLCRDIRHCKGSLLIAADQEGGRVQRFRKGFLALPPLGEIGAVWDVDPDKAVRMAYAHAWLMASEVLAYGLDLSFAPVLDIGHNREVIGDRAFHTDLEAIKALAERYLQGMHQAGMAATGKHYPGHGWVKGDSHHELPVDDRPLEVIESADLSVFQQLIDKKLDAVMVAHVLYPQVDNVQAGYSPKWCQTILREQQGFKGLVISDDLDMSGAGEDLSLAGKVGACLSAGCDIQLLCQPDTARQVLGWEVDAARRSDIQRLRRRVSIAPEKLYNSALWNSSCQLLETL